MVGKDVVAFKEVLQLRPASFVYLQKDKAPVDRDEEEGMLKVARPLELNPDMKNVSALETKDAPGVNRSHN